MADQRTVRALKDGLGFENTDHGTRAALLELERLRALRDSLKAAAAEVRDTFGDKLRDVGAGMPSVAALLELVDQAVEGGSK